MVDRTEGGASDSPREHAPRKPGRPATGKARTAGERMRAMREKALEIAADPEGHLSSVPDTGLLEALRVAYRDGQAATLRRIADELLRRAEHRAQK